MFVCFIVPNEDPVRVENVYAIEVQKFPRQPRDSQFSSFADYLPVSDREIIAVKLGLEIYDFWVTPTLTCSPNCTRASMTAKKSV